MKISDQVADRINEKLKRLKTRDGHKKLISDIFYPSRQRDIDRKVANEYADKLQPMINELEVLVKSLRAHIDYIGDPDKYVAAYLLIGKSFTTLKSLNILVKEGFSFQIIELIRSSIESLNLAAYFLEDGTENILKRWFNGEIINNNTARQGLNNAVNKMMKKLGKQPVPMREALSDIYSIYSSYTHSGYSALFDFIDVFKEDFDFDQSAQLHYNRKNLDLIEHLFTNILLSLKNFFIRKHDEENLTKVEEILLSVRGSFASQEEIDKEFDRYK